MASDNLCPEDYQGIFNAFISYKRTDITIHEKLFKYTFIANCFNNYIVQNGFTKKAQASIMANGGVPSAQSPSSSILMDYVVSDVDNIDTPQNINECNGLLKETHAKLQTCNLNINEIIRESNYATQNANMNEAIQTMQAQLTEFSNKISQQNDLINSKDQNYTVLHSEYNKLLKAYTQYKDAHEQAEIVNRQLTENIKILNENTDQIKMQLHNLHKENNMRISELNTTKSMLSQMEDELKQQTSQYENALAWKDKSCDQTMIENEKMRLQNFNQNNQINELKNTNENLQKYTLKISAEFNKLLANNERLTRNNEQTYTDQVHTTQSLSQILANLEASDRQIDHSKDTVNKRRSIENIRSSGISKLKLLYKPFELKAFLYGTVSHAAHDIGEVNRSLLYMGRHNFKMVLRNRRFEGMQYKNSIQILSDKSQQDIINYKNSFVKLLEEVVA